MACHAIDPVQDPERKLGHFLEVLPETSLFRGICFIFPRIFFDYAIGSKFTLLLFS